MEIIDTILAAALAMVDIGEKSKPMGEKRRKLNLMEHQFH